uniref:Uncharacterized protein n=1 Tax=Romanomermis culicivorax TaxID=13658 RepID=A0A915JN58_ROMCU
MFDRTIADAVNGHRRRKIVRQKVVATVETNQFRWIECKRVTNLAAMLFGLVDLAKEMSMHRFGTGSNNDSRFCCPCPTPFIEALC